MAQIITPQRGPGALDTLMKGLNIASQVYGIRTNMAQLDDLQRKQQKEQDLSEGKLDKGQQLQLSQNYNISTEKPKDGQYQVATDLATNSPIYMTMKKDTSPLIREIPSYRNGQSGTLVTDVKSGKELQWIPGKPEDIKTREVKVTDKDGNEITQIVADKPGQSFVGTSAKQPNKEQYDAALYARRLESANSVMDKLSANGYNRASQSQGIQSYLMPGAFKSDDLKQQEQAERNFVNAILRRESGAAISPAEFASAEQQYFPRAGDSEQVLNQKAQNRAQAFEGLKAASGNAFEKVPLVAINPAGNKKSTSGQAFAAPASNDPILDQLKQRAQNGDKKAQEYLNSLGGK